MDCSPPGSFARGISQARILKWTVMLFSRGSSRPRDWTQVSRIVGRHFTLWTTREALEIGAWRGAAKNYNLKLQHRNSCSSELLLLFSHSVMSKSLRPHGLQHTSLLCPSPSPGVRSNSHPSSQWCHPTISSSVVPFSSCLLPFPKVGGKDLSQHQGLFQWVSSSHQVARVLEFKLQYLSFQWISRVDFFRIDWFDLLAIQGTFRNLLQHQFEGINSLVLSLFYCPVFTYVRD